MTKLRRNLLTAGIVLALLAVIGGVAIGLAEYKLRRDPVTRAVREAQRELKDVPQGSSERAAVWNRHRDRIYEMMLARHPELAVTYKDVPDERNGFLKWLEFDAKHGEAGSDPLKVPDDIKKMVCGEEWEAGRVSQWLTEHAAWLEEIEAIGLLPEQSVKGLHVPELGMSMGRLAKVGSDMLFLRARLEAERGRPDLALRSMQAARVLADHLDQIETPCLYLATVGILLRRSVSGCFFDHVLPTLRGSDVRLWNETLRLQPARPAELGRILRGEWHVGMRDLVFGALMDKNGPTDAGPVLEAWANDFVLRVALCESIGLDRMDLLVGLRPTTRGLSASGKAMLDPVGLDEWVKGWWRSQLYLARDAAAFAHLLGEPLPNEPITGKPFVWDEAAQSIRFPEDERLKAFDLKPLVVRRSTR